jgi:hypothetical protein
MSLSRQQYDWLTEYIASRKDGVEAETCEAMALAYCRRFGYKFDERRFLRDLQTLTGEGENDGIQAGDSSMVEPGNTA